MSGKSRCWSVCRVTARFILAAALSASLLVACAPGQQPARSEVNAGVSTVRRDITYRTVDGVSLTMDVYTPKGKGSGPFPAVMYVHGGGWKAGDKGEGAGFTEAPELLARGYVVVSINYRLAPKYTVPIQIEDVKYAVRYLKSNSKGFNIDPDRLGAMGSSAGGHLVSLLGVTGPEDGLEGDFDLPAKSSRVRAVVDMFGPADLEEAAFAKLQAKTVQDAFGLHDLGEAALPVLRKYSPVTYVSQDDPPFLIVHGDKDATVPLSQSEAFYKALKEAGVPATLLVVKNGGHSLKPAGGAISPPRPEVSKAVADFFDQVLSPSRPTP